MKLNTTLNMIFLAIIWGPTAFVMKIATNYYSPLAITTLTSFTTSISLLLYLKYKKIKILTPNIKTLAPHAIFMSIIGYGIPVTLQCYSVKSIPSIWIGVLTASTPILTAALTKIFLNKKISLAKLLAILLGFIGFLVIIYDSHFNDESQTTLKGTLLGGSSVLFYASAIVYAERFKKNMPSLVTPFYQFTFSFLILLPICVLFKEPFNINLDINAILSILYLGIPATSIGFLVYYKIIRRDSAVTLSLVNYMLPIIKTLLGVLFLNEVINLNFILASFFILLSLFLY